MNLEISVDWLIEHPVQAYLAVNIPFAVLMHFISLIAYKRWNRLVTGGDAPPPRGDFISGYSIFWLFLMRLAVALPMFVVSNCLSVIVFVLVNTLPIVFNVLASVVSLSCDPLKNTTFYRIYFWGWFLKPYYARRWIDDNEGGPVVILHQYDGERGKDDHLTGTHWTPYCRESCCSMD